MEIDIDKDGDGEKDSLAKVKTGFLGKSDKIEIDDDFDGDIDSRIEFKHHFMQKDTIEFYKRRRRTNYSKGRIEEWRFPGRQAQRDAIP